MRKRKLQEIKDMIDATTKRMMLVADMSDDELRETMRSPVAEVRTIANNEAARRWAESLISKDEQ